MSVATPYIRNTKLLIPIPVDCTAGPVNVNLQTGNTAVTYIKIDSSANALTITAPNGYTIQGDATYVIGYQGVAVQFLLTGTVWGATPLSIANLFEIITNPSISTLQLEVDTLQAEVGTLQAELLPTPVSTAVGDVVETMSATAIHASYIKSTVDANIVSFDTSDGSTFAENNGTATESAITLETQNSRVTFDRVGDVWYRA